MRCFCLITKSFWGFLASNLGPDCSINSHKLTYNSHCSIWRWYHTCARFISVFPWKYISRSYGRIWHASFFPAMLYTSVVRVTLHPIPIPSFPIIPSFPPRWRSSIWCLLRSHPQCQTLEISTRENCCAAWWRIQPSNIRNVHSVTVLGTITYPLPMALLKMMFLFPSSLEGI